MRLMRFFGLWIWLFIPAKAMAGDPASLVREVGDLPPEAQVRIVRVILDDLFGTPQELGANFINACKSLEVSESSPTTDKQSPHRKFRLDSGKVLDVAQTGSLHVLCTAPVRKAVLHALDWKPVQEANDSTR